MIDLRQMRNVPMFLVALAVIPASVIFAMVWANPTTRSRTLVAQPMNAGCDVPNAAPVPTDAPRDTRLPTIDPHATLADLLPTAPTRDEAPVYLGDNLAAVPELKLEASLGSAARSDQWHARKAHTAAAALRLDAEREDGFLKALVRTRPDLSGLPFLMGDACRTEKDLAKTFKVLATDSDLREGKAPGPVAVNLLARADEKQRQQAHVAVLAQILPAHEGPSREPLLRSLAAINRAEATRELARVAVFSPDENARAVALEKLAGRSASEYTDVLVAGLSYPWPAVAENAAAAIVKLGRKDLVPRLEAMLEEPDPRGPRSEPVGDREETVARELVRINHHRNCLLCHSPADPSNIPTEALIADVPLPSEPFSADGTYGPSTDPFTPRTNLLVRVDRTYLRQDFSAIQAASERSAWPERQRFDFVVRRRVLTPDEADDLKKRLEGPSPYRRAAVRALRELTGRDFDAKPAAEVRPF